MCAVCGQRIAGREVCVNRLCSSADRQFNWSAPVAMKVGQLDRVIRTWKDDRKWGYGVALGRILLGHLQSNRDKFGRFDLIIPSPSYRDSFYDPHYDYTAFVLAQARMHDESGLPFAGDEPVIERTARLPRMREARNYRERERIAQELRATLKVQRPDVILGRSVLVFDDVFTTGHSLNETARALRAAGAVEVSQVVLARQPWTEHYCGR
ncbi:ComF family protein [Frankia sp. AgKG'84/4]|uniref:ComF family protein n=1 Tax=Frankia sp. AgKG'84/4 TaxID=573490 RepID=UPI002029D77B|nr:phosphoribosyltransferase family protein [Frankia sp. AgKG'84/4]MCL9796048.1 hypothetical protein [Frankia sp. AgKG'84/4]